MTKKRNDPNAPLQLSRRSAVAAAGACFAMLSQKALAAMGKEPTSAWPAGAGPLTTDKATFTKDSEADGVVEYTGIHAGKGKGKMKFFRFDGTSAPAHFLIYDLPPGASEGVHVHHLDNRNNEGSFDEYYYIISGQGQMEIYGEIVPVAKGEHVHTPLDVAHGIENTHPTENLRVFLTFIKRGNEPD
jgi:mannose-6-phosphate isomerase-like protein (cupin superfamily)